MRPLPIAVSKLAREECGLTGWAQLSVLSMITGSTSDTDINSSGCVC